MFRTFASAEFQHSIFTFNTYIDQFNHLLKLYKKGRENEAKEYFKCNKWCKTKEQTQQSNTDVWEQIYNSKKFNDINIVNVYILLKGVEMLGTLPQKLAEKLKVAENGEALRDAPDELKNDREVVLVAVAKYGAALEYASKDLKNDKEIVMVAVAHKAYALKYASAELKNDKEVVLAAVAQDGRALEYASDEVKKMTKIGCRMS